VTELLYFLGGCLFSLILYFIQNNRKKKLRDKLNELDAHFEYIQKLRRSSVELNRRAFMWLFLVLFCISVSLLVPIFIKIFVLQLNLLFLSEKLSLAITFSLLLFAAIASFAEFSNYRDVSNFARATKRIEEKKKKLTEKLENI
jgi:F0F1-type ATP synthase membrane subunit a